MPMFDTLHPDFKPLIEDMYEYLLDLCDDANCSPYISSTWRSEGRQWDLYRKGRRQVGEVWVRVPGQNIVTRAKPSETPHCVTLKGEPASCAIDIALIEKGKHKWLGDFDQRWSLIPAAASVTSPKLVSGGFFRSIRDFPHVELEGWQKLR